MKGRHEKVFYLPDVWYIRSFCTTLPVGSVRKLSKSKSEFETGVQHLKIPSESTTSDHAMRSTARISGSSSSTINLSSESSLKHLWVSFLCYLSPWPSEWTQRSPAQHQSLHLPTQFKCRGQKVRRYFSVPNRAKSTSTSSRTMGSSHWHGSSHFNCSIFFRPLTLRSQEHSGHLVNVSM